MIANPKATILVIDPTDSSRWIEVRGQVKEITQESAKEHADKLTQRYCYNNQHFYGDIYPVEHRCNETRVIVKVQPSKVCLDAVFR
jgi:hypothetical protein